MKLWQRLTCVVLAISIMMGFTTSMPTTVSAQHSPSLSVFLTNEEFVYPMSENEVQLFLADYPGSLKSYTFENQGYSVPAARAIAFQGELWGVSPRVLLSLLELKSRLLTVSYPRKGVLEQAMGNHEATQQGFAAQLAWAAEELSLGFYDRYYQENKTQVVLSNGKVIEIAPEINAGTYALLRFLALGTDEKQWQTWVSQNAESFYTTYTQLFGSIELPEQSTLTPTAITAPDNMRLPWGNSETWYYTGGPHDGAGGGQTIPYSCVDYAPGGGTGCRWVNQFVRAVKGGTIVYANCNLVRVDHGGGWSTSYFHLEDIQVSLNQTVAAGAPLGRPGCGTGAACGWSGRATGSHVHFGVRLSNIHQPIDGMVFGGWTVRKDSQNRAYYGTMVKDGVTKYAYAGSGDSIRAYEDSDPDDGRTLTSGQDIYGTRNPGNDEDPYYINGTAGQVLTVEMWKNNSNLDTYVYVRDPNNQTIGVNDDASGTTDSRLVVTLQTSGRFIVVAKGYNDSTGAYRLRATLASSSGSDNEDGRWLSHDQTRNGVLNSNSDEDTYYFSGVSSRIVSIKLWKDGSNVDTVLEVYSPTGNRVAFNDDSENSTNSWVVFIAPNTGTYRVKARSYEHSSSGAYQIRLRLVDANNLALNKSVSASSVENGRLLPAKAVDGDPGTRWSSRFSDPQWIEVDLGASRRVDTAILRWETAYARRYGIYYWTGSYWSNLYWTDSGNGGADMVRFTPTTARYFMMYASQRGTQWGISLWEFGLYNSSTALPPDPEPYTDLSKTPDSIGENPPPAATSPGKDEGVLALTVGEDGAQEFAPAENTWPGDMPNANTGDVGVPVAVIQAIQSDRNDIGPDETFTFIGMAEDTDQEGAGAPIVAYEWRSNIAGLLSAQSEFTRTAVLLTTGVHTITFRAQDNEGIWSPSAVMTFTVQAEWQERMYVYLPLVIRQ